MNTPAKPIPTAANQAANPEQRRFPTAEELAKLPPGVSRRLGIAIKEIAELQKQVRSAGLPVAPYAQVRKNGILQNLRVQLESAEAEVQRLRAQLRQKQSAAIVVKATMDRTAAAFAAANTPESLWAEYRKLDPAAKNAFYKLHKKILDR